MQKTLEKVPRSKIWLPQWIVGPQKHTIKWSGNKTSSKTTQQKNKNSIANISNPAAAKNTKWWNTGDEKLHQQEHYYNKSAKELPPLQEGDVIRAQPLAQGEKWTTPLVTRRLDERSYVIKTVTAMYQCNRVHLRKTSELPPVISIAWVRIPPLPPCYNIKMILPLNSRIHVCFITWWFNQVLGLISIIDNKYGKP